MQIIIRTYDLQLKHTFTISRQSFDIKPTMVIELKDGEFSGFGEASENPYYKRSRMRYGVFVVFLCNNNSFSTSTGLPAVDMVS